MKPDTDAVDPLDSFDLVFSPIVLGPLDVLLLARAAEQAADDAARLGRQQ
jgi:hypothetical protein